MLNLLIIPYACYSSLNILLIFIWQILKGTFTCNVLLKTIFAHAIGLQGLSVAGCGCGPLWFLYTLIIIKFICLFFNRSCIYILSIVCFASAIYLTATGFDKDWAITNTLVALPCFSIGLLFSQFKNKVMKMKKYISESTVIAAAFMIISLLGLTYIASIYTGPVRMFKCGYGSNPLLFLVSTTLGTGAIATISIRLDTVFSKYATIISKGNIVILAFHFHIIRILSRFVGSLYRTPLLHDMALLIISAVIMICFIPIILAIQKYAPILMGKR